MLGVGQGWETDVVQASVGMGPGSKSLPSLAQTWQVESRHLQLLTTGCPFDNPGTCDRLSRLAFLKVQVHPNWHQSSCLCSPPLCKGPEMGYIVRYLRTLPAGCTWHTYLLPSLLTSSEIFLRSLLPRNEASAFLCWQLGPSGDTFWLAHVSSQMPLSTFP